MSRAIAARLDASLSPEQAAKRARVSLDYLKRIERHGGAPFPLAQRLARVYGCGIQVFLRSTTTGGNTKNKTSTKSRPYTRLNRHFYATESQQTTLSRKEKQQGIPT